MGAGIHPDAAFGDVVHVPGERYAVIAEAMRGLMRRTPTCALHVHVGMPDPETAIRTYNGLRTCLPLVQALAANSAFWHGVDSGFMTARAQLFRSLPSAVIPPRVRGLGGVRRLPGGVGGAGLHAPVVGRAAASAPRHGGGPRHGRAVADRVGGAASPRSCTGWRSPSRPTPPRRRRRPARR